MKNGRHFFNVDQTKQICNGDRLTVVPKPMTSPNPVASKVSMMSLVILHTFLPARASEQGNVIGYVRKYTYSETSKQRTLWDRYKFKWFVPCIEVVLFKSFKLIGGIKFVDLVLSIVERYIIQCPFIGGSSLRGSTIYICVYKKNCN